MVRGYGRVVRNGLVAIVVVAIAVIVLMLTTPIGQRGLVAIGGRLASTPNAQLEISGLEGSLLSSGRIGRIALSDAEGVWLDVRDVHFEWRPSSLLGGTLAIDLLEAGLVDLKRVPETSGAPANGGAGGETLLPIGIRLVKAAIAELHLGALVIGAGAGGTAARLSVDASLDAMGTGQDISGRLNVRRIDGPAGKLDAALRYVAATGEIEADIETGEPAGGLVATLLDSPGRPPLRATLVGRGTLDDLHAALTLVSGEKPFTLGRGRVRRTGAGYDVSAELDGYLTTVLPAKLRDLFGGRTKAKIAARLFDDGKVRLEKATLASEAVALAASGSFDPGRHFATGEATVKVGRADGRAVALPVPGDGHVHLGKALIRLRLENATAAREVSLVGTAEAISAENQARIATVAFDARAIQPAPAGAGWQTLKDIEVKGNAADVVLLDGADDRLRVPRVTFESRGGASAGTLDIEAFSATGAGIEMAGRGRVGKQKAEVRLTAKVASLANFAGLAGRPLAGSVTLAAEGDLDVTSGASAARVTVDLVNPEIGLPQADRLLIGRHAVKARLTFDGERRYTLRDFTMTGDGVTARGGAVLDEGVPDGSFEATVRDLSRLDKALAGQLTAKGKIAGKDGGITGDVDVSGDRVHIHGRPVTGVVLNARGQQSGGGAAAQVSLRATVDGEEGAAAFRVEQDGSGFVRVDDVAMSFGKNRVNGWLGIGGAAGISGDLAVDLPRLETFSGLAGQAMAGRLTARIAPAPEFGHGGLSMRLDGEGIKVGEVRLERVTSEALVAELLAAPFGRLRLAISKGRIGERPISGVSVTADGDKGAPLRFALRGRSDTARLSAGGTAARQGEAYAVTIERAELKMAKLASSLAAPAKLRFGAKGVVVDKVTLGVGSGRIIVSGRTGERLDVDAELVKLPLALADLVQPGLGAAGQLSGRLRVAGPAAQPVATFKLAVAGASVAEQRNAGVAPVSISGDGRFENNVASVDFSARGSDGLSASVRGKVHHKAQPLLDLTARGDVPLNLMNLVLAGRGTRGEGVMKIEGAIRGTAAAPRVDLTATIRGAAIDDPASGIRLTGVTSDIRASEKEVVLARFAAQANGGGALEAGARVRFEADGEHPVSGDIRVRGLKLQDHHSMTGTLDAQMSVSGALNRALSVTGDIALKRFDVLLPEPPPRAVRELDIEHVNVPASRRDELGAKPASAQDAAKTTPIQLNIRIRSNDKIFARGRGLDAQLGGGLRLVGDARSPSADGEFRMIRGRLAIVGRRLTFNRGSIGFAGSLDPSLDFEATTTVEDTVITTRVSGRASQPKISFESSPQLPEDEVFARLLFNKSLTKLSPLQIAQLASEIDRLGGLSGGSGIMDELRKSVGVDALDVGTDKKGNATVSAGKHVSPNAYVGVQQNTGTNDSRVIIDLDITKNIKARGETGSDGNSKVGVGVEWNY